MLLKTAMLCSVFLPPANEVWGKVIFLHLFVILFTGGGMHGSLGGHTWLFGGHTWLLLGSVHGCSQGGMRDCSGGGMRGCSGEGGGMHGCSGGMHGCSGGGMHGCSWGACMGYDKIRRYGQ